MDIKYILEFVELVDAGKFSTAADRLFLSQSSLSKHMKTLESDLGVDLFERETKRKVILSEFGKLYLPYAEQIAILHKEYLALQEQQKKALSATLKIGSIPPMMPYRITDLLASFQEQQPGLILDVEELETAISCERIRQGTLDCAFIREKPDSPDLTLEHISYTADRLCVVLRKDHPLAGRKYIRLEQLHNENFLLLKENSFMYDMCIRACERAGFIPNVTYTGSRGDNIANMVSRGSGVALLTKRPIENMRFPHVEIVDIEPPITTEISLVYSSEAGMRKELDQFLQFIREQLDDPKE